MMKLKFFALAVAAAATFAASAAPVSLPNGPYYLKFDGRQQVAVAGDTGYANEINWGVFTVYTINYGQLTGPNTIEATGAPTFSNLLDGGQITGIYYGTQGLPSGTGGNAFPATGGYLDLYYRDTSIYGATDLADALPSVRTSQSTADGFTDGILLAHLAFASGINDLSAEVFINGSTIPSNGGFAGLSTSYANVDMSILGDWSEQMNTDFFSTNWGTRDIRFRNIYESLDSWSNCPDPASNCLLGANVTDPATGYVVPEPTSLALIGVALVGTVALGRRRRRAPHVA
jgi:hypothetical protein